jgi:hypothetical protein
MIMPIMPIRTAAVRISAAAFLCKDDPNGANNSLAQIVQTGIRLASQDNSVDIIKSFAAVI